MKLSHVLLLGTSFLAFGSSSDAQGDLKLENANAAVVGAFETHDIVMFGEFHGNKQEYAWLRSLVATPEFADLVDDIVMEMGNSLYQIGRPLCKRRRCSAGAGAESMAQHSRRSWAALASNCVAV